MKRVIGLFAAMLMFSLSVRALQRPERGGGPSAEAAIEAAIHSAATAYGPEPYHGAPAARGGERERTIRIIRAVPGL